MLTYGPVRCVLCRWMGLAVRRTASSEVVPPPTRTSPSHPDLGLQLYFFWTANSPGIDTSIKLQKGTYL